MTSHTAPQTSDREPGARARRMDVAAMAITAWPFEKLDG
jgi:hypothetical protein